MIHMVGMIFQKGAENPRLSRLIILRKNTTTALTVSIIQSALDQLIFINVSSQLGTAQLLMLQGIV